jgi:prepilin peptidase CpaA
MGLHDFLMHLGAGATVLVVAFGCFAMGWVGGGDAKVAAGVALWFGFDHLLNYLLYASLLGGALTLLLLQFQAMAAALPLNGQAWLLRLHDKQSGDPLRHRARDRRADDLSGDRVDQGGRPATPASTNALILAAVTLR